MRSCLERVSSWQGENGNVRFIYSQKDDLYAQLLRSREQAETVRSACAEILGGAIKITVEVEDTMQETPKAR